MKIRVINARYKHLLIDKINQVYLILYTFFMFYILLKINVLLLLLCVVKKVESCGRVGRIEENLQYSLQWSLKDGK